MLVVGDFKVGVSPAPLAVFQEISRHFPSLPIAVGMRVLVLMVAVVAAGAFQPVMSTGVLRSAITATDVSPLMLVRRRDTRELHTCTNASLYDASLLHA